MIELLPVVTPMKYSVGWLAGVRSCMAAAQSFIAMMRSTSSGGRGT